jgi:conjugal transfer/entry exclusion protein
MESESFREKLDTLIELFKKVRERSMEKEIPGIDKSFFQNFDFVLNNYEMIKDQLSDEMLEQFGTPIQTLIENLINQLKDELGEDFYALEPMKEVSDDLQEIEKLLQSSELSNDEIDKLLDKRANILSNKDQNKQIEE